MVQNLLPATPLPEAELIFEYLIIWTALAKCSRNSVYPEGRGGEVSTVRDNTLGYSSLKVSKIFIGLFPSCSGHCLVTPGVLVYFPSNKTKASTLLFVSLRQLCKFVMP